MSDELYMVVTTNGARVIDGKGKGLPRDQAEAAVSEKNASAGDYGITARYKVAPFVKAED